MPVTYKKVIADGIPVASYKGDMLLYIKKIINLRGIHIEIATKEEYEKFKNKRKRKKEIKSLLLPGL